MPHLLVAGTTGSGKSVAVNSMILSLLYRFSPAECRMIMIDPKMLELSVYDDIPHLLHPVVIDPAKAVVALKWAVREMNARYRLMSHLNVRNIAGYNKRLADAAARGETLDRTVQTGYDPDTGRPTYETQPVDMTPLPFVVVVVDEVADLMLVAGKDIEVAIQSLAQKARAAGIHLIIATQRPSVDVITGTIKANLPTRISFQVTSKIDSRTILGEQGAEQLLGMGDMLYMAGGGKVARVHGPFVADGEVEEVAAFVRAQGVPDYLDSITARRRRRRRERRRRRPGELRATTCSTAPWRSSRASARPRPASSSATCPSATTGRRASSSGWRPRAWSARRTTSASARCCCPRPPTTPEPRRRRGSPAPVDRRGVEDRVEGDQGAALEQRLGGQQPVPGVAVGPVEPGGVFGVIVADGQLVDGVAPQRGAQFLRRQVDAPPPRLPLQLVDGDRAHQHRVRGVEDQAARGR